VDSVSSIAPQWKFFRDERSVRVPVMAHRIRVFVD
jgi:hypothetical protein